MFTTYNLMTEECLSFKHYGAACVYIIKTMQKMEKECPGAVYDVRRENGGFIFEIWENGALILQK